MTKAGQRRWHGAPARPRPLSTWLLVLAAALFVSSMTAAQTGQPQNTVRLEHFADWLNGQWKNTSDHSNTTGWTNFFVTEICYVPQKKRFEGRVVQNGVGSRDIGFQVGDLHWIATRLDADKGVVSGETNFRYGAGGVTHQSHWLPFEIRLAESSIDLRVEFADLRSLSEPPRIYRMARHGPAAACPEVAKPVFKRP